MAILKNNERNVFLTINLIRNDYLDFKSSNDLEKWIPFTMSLKTPKKKYDYMDGKMTFNVFEIKKLLVILKEIGVKKKKKQQIPKYSFYCSEAYFELDLEDPLEDELVEVLIWFNVGALTNGVNYGFDEGCRFNVKIDDLELFYNEIEMNFKVIISN
ncbi:MAG: hypothetical protein GY756_10275 [bacterium]|nr:hypothetical protein [bacterium]